MILPDEEQAWIEKYREAMDAWAVGESRTSRIRVAWSHLTFAVVSASQDLVRRARTLTASEPATWPSKPKAETAESVLQSSAFEQTQSSGGSSMDEEPEHGAAVSLACEAEIGSEPRFASAANELIHLE